MMADQVRPEDHVGLVRYWANKAAAKYSNVDPEELWSSGFIGLIRACELFKPELGNKFSTYATYWIRQGIGRFLEVYLHGGTRNVVVYRELEKGRQSLGKDATVPELAEFMEKSEEAIEKMIKRTKASRPMPGDMEISSRYGEPVGTILDQVEDRGQADPSKPAEMRDLINYLIEGFSDREKMIFRRYFMAGEQMQKIGDELSVSRSRVEQIIIELRLVMISRLARAGILEGFDQERLKRMMCRQEAVRMIKGEPGEILKSLRLEGQISQQGLERKLGVAKSTINKIEQGHLRMTPRIAALVEDFFGLQEGSMPAPGSNYPTKKKRKKLKEAKKKMTYDGADIKKRIDDLGIEYLDFCIEANVTINQLMAYANNEVERVRPKTLNKILDNLTRLESNGAGGKMEAELMDEIDQKAAALGVPMEEPSEKEPLLDSEAMEREFMAMKSMSDILDNFEPKEARRICIWLMDRHDLMDIEI